MVFSAAAVAACGDDGNVLGSDGSSGTAGAMSAGGASAGAGRGGSAATAGEVGKAGAAASAGMSGASGAGGSNDGAGACATSECFRPNVCLDECGGTVKYTGCCACAAPLVEELSCSDAGAGGEGGSGAAASTQCAGTTCAGGESCVAYRTVGGAIVQPDTNGECQPGRHLEGTICQPDFEYTCTSLAHCAEPAPTCGCAVGSPCAQTNLCRLPDDVAWLDASAELVCEQQVP